LPGRGGRDVEGASDCVEREGGPHPLKNYVFTLDPGFRPCLSQVFCAQVSIGAKKESQASIALNALVSCHSGSSNGATIRVAKTPNGPSQSSLTNLQIPKIKAIFKMNPNMTIRE
jgi:hypothetical protein